MLWAHAMSAGSAYSKSVRVSLILVVGALMLLPAGALLSSGGASALSTSLSGPNTGASSFTTLAHPTAPSSSLYAGLPATLSHVPWLQSLEQSGPQLKPLTSLPNLQLLKHPVTANGTVSPFYVAQPAPLGVADYGLGATPYSYNTSHIMGQVTFNAPPNVTDPASTSVVEPSLGAQHQGYVGSMYEFGIQLNTVATNITLPGSNQGFFWTQNVVNWNDTGIHFVDDTFNLTSATQSPFVIQPGTIAQGCNNGSAGVNEILFVYGGVFQCVGQTIPISPAAYPITIQLYNNASVNAANQTIITYGYHILEWGIPRTYSGISDMLVFNNPNSTAPVNSPGFSVDGFQGAPAGLFRDAELDLVGDIGGDNSVFRSLNASAWLGYSNNSSGVFQSVPSAYNFGGDTGETSTGIADFWTPSHTLEMNQGPAMLYGLWGAVPSVSVASGDIQVSGTIHPDFGLVFISNTRPVMDPWGTGLRDNLSWVPTTNSGAFNTYLPPLGGAWTSHYYVRAFADGYAEHNASPITGPTTSENLVLTSSPGTLNAPLYMFGDAQASNIALAVTGSGAAPYTFSNLVVNMNFTFNHLNDYGFPTFVVFMAQGVPQIIHVNDTYQGDDSPAGNFYFLDYANPASGIFGNGPQTTGSLPYFTSGINIFDSRCAFISNQTTAADGYGLQVVLWQDYNARVSWVTSLYGSSGVWVGDSYITHVRFISAALGATGVSDIGSYYTSVWWLTAIGPGAVGIDGLSSYGGTYARILATDGAIGIETGDNYGAEVGYDAYYYFPGTTDLTIRNVEAWNGSWGANISLSSFTLATGISAYLNGSIGITFDESPVAVVIGVLAFSNSTGVQIIDSGLTAVAGVLALNWSTGVWVWHSSYLDLQHVTAINHSTGIWMENARHVSINHVFADYYSTGVWLKACHQVTINHVAAAHHSTAVYVA
jgi:Thermopsin